MCMLSILDLVFTFSRSISVGLPVGFFGSGQNSALLIGVTPTASFILAAIAATIDSQQLPWLILATLLFALLALAMLFFYNYKIQSRSYDVLESLGMMGKTVKVTSSAPFVRPDTKESLKSTVSVLNIEEPAVVTVGVKSGEFTATVERKPAPPETRWTVTPATAATVSPKSGPIVKVIATAAGASQSPPKFLPRLTLIFLQRTGRH